MRTEPINAALFHAVHRAGIAACVACWVCASAHAQSVQKCRIDGRMVFQTSPCPLEARPAAAAVPQAAASAAARKRTLAELLQERDAADRERPVSQPLRADGADVLRARMGAL